MAARGGTTARLGARVLRSRRLVRAPLWLYRHHLGWLLGRRVVMVEHVGRRSGLPRQVCLEVVDRPSADVVTVMSGFGKQAQWFRNLHAHPDCWITTGPTGTRRGRPSGHRSSPRRPCSATPGRTRPPGDG